MKELKKIFRKISTVLPALAFVIGIISANSACAAFYYQPETPDAMSKYRR